MYTIDLYRHYVPRIVYRPCTRHYVPRPCTRINCWCIVHVLVTMFLVHVLVIPRIVHALVTMFLVPVLVLSTRTVVLNIFV
jgi:hypothetical protein